jgi:hypothetical protein
MILIMENDQVFARACVYEAHLPPSPPKNNKVKTVVIRADPQAASHIVWHSHVSNCGVNFYMHALVIHPISLIWLDRCAH